TKKGVRFTAGVLATSLSTNALAAAPAGLAANIATNVLLAAPQSASLVSLIKFMIVSKTKTAAITLLFAASLTAPLLFNRPAAAKLAGLEMAVADQKSQLLAIASENDRLFSQITNLDQTDA